MDKYGFEHLRFSRSTYRHRNVLLILGCLSILFFEYHIAEELKIYNVNIPKPLIGLSLYLSSIWTTIQFLFCSIDDYIDWKKNFLIDRSVWPKGTTGDRTILAEIHSFSKGKIKYFPIVGQSYGGNVPNVPDIKEINSGIKSVMEQLEKRLKEEIKSIENFKKWYKRYSWLTIFRFAFLEFTLPLLFIIYSLLICQYLPILPK